MLTELVGVASDYDVIITGCASKRWCPFWDKCQGMKFYNWIFDHYWRWHCPRERHAVTMMMAMMMVWLEIASEKASGNIKLDRIMFETARPEQIVSRTTNAAVRFFNESLLKFASSNLKFEFFLLISISFWFVKSNYINNLNRSASHVVISKKPVCFRPFWSWFSNNIKIRVNITSRCRKKLYTI